MSRVCQITGKRTVSGRRFSRRGKAKREGGIGKHISGVSKRTFRANLQWKKIYVPELRRTVRVRISTRALKTVTRKGAFRTLLDAGLVKPPRPKKK